MLRSASIAVVTCFAFAWAVLWPDVVRADNAPAATAPAPAEDPSLAAAKQHFEAGRAAYNANDFQNAIREFKAAEQLRPSPILAYNIGLANEKLGRKKVAVRYYKRYLEGAPAAANRGEVEGRIASLEKEIAAQPAAQPPEQPADNPPPPPANPPPPDPNAPPQTTASQGDPYANQPPLVTPTTQKRRIYWWVWLLVGIGAAVVVTAIVVGVVFGLRASDPYYYYYDAQVPVPDRLRGGAERRELIERSAGVPPSRTADTLSVFQVRF